MDRTSKSAEKRWTAYVKKCAELKTFDHQVLRKEYCVDARVIKTLVDMGWAISSKKGKYNWICPHPLTDNDISAFVKAHREYIKKFMSTTTKYDKLKFETAPLRAKYEILDSKVDITEEQAIERLRIAGGYEIYKVEKKSIL